MNRINSLVIILFAINFSSCLMIKKNTGELNSSISNLNTCSDELSPIVEIWNHSGNDFIIGKYSATRDTYVKSDGWNNTDFPFPKKFDVKIQLVANARLFGDENYRIPKCSINVYISYKVGKNKDSTYPLNSFIQQLLLSIS